MVKDLRKTSPRCALPWNDLAVLASDPTALPAVLVLPVFGITYAGLGLDVVEPDIFYDFTVGSDVLAGDRAGVAPNTFVEVEHHGDLCANLHSADRLDEHTSELQALMRYSYAVFCFQIIK